MKIYAVIMAGGVGSRFWPRSRERKPKQLINIFGENSLIQNTVNRLNGLVPHENVFIITNKFHKEEILNQLENINPDNVIAEPVGRNTAPCILLASKVIYQLDKDSVCLVLPADHLIKEEENFRETLKKAADYAYSSENVLTIGISPTRPETGYGYIQIESKEISPRIHPVKTFAEKPNYATAVRFLESGDFYWNSGMFIWKTEVILQELKKHLPELYKDFSDLVLPASDPGFESSVEKIYGSIRGISIDYGVMEKSEKVSLIKSNFIWSDVGSWEEVYQLSEKNGTGNVFEGTVYADSTLDSFVYSPDKFTAIIGAENLLVINTKDSLLVCRRDKAQDVKKVVEFLKEHKLDDLV
ncbi:MAG: mannose-1-phosphate guanylyltransferase [Ignavibacteriaceae bacterium]|nr:mannose-1-phosphate guanylyltransferase [Ignavibacteriaceae bacterium]